MKITENHLRILRLLIKSLWLNETLKKNVILHENAQNMHAPKIVFFVLNDEHHPIIWKIWKNAKSYATPFFVFFIISCQI